MTFKITKKGNKRVITFEGDLTLQNAEKMKKALLKSLETAGQVTLKLDRVTSLDLSCLQLLCSAHRTAVRKNRPITLSISCPELFQRFVREAGFIRHIGCEMDHKKSCLWICEAAQT